MSDGMMTPSKGLYPSVTIERDWTGNMKVWRGEPVTEGQKWNTAFPQADVLIQGDIERVAVLVMLPGQERADYESGYRVTVHSIDPALFGEYADQPGWFQKLIDEYRVRQ